MKINVNTKSEPTPIFGDVKVGDIFLAEGIPYLKIARGTTGEYNNSSPIGGLISSSFSYNKPITLVTQVDITI